MGRRDRFAGEGSIRQPCPSWFGAGCFGFRHSLDGARSRSTVGRPPPVTARRNRGAKGAVCRTLQGEPSLIGFAAKSTRSREIRWRRHVSPRQGGHLDVIPRAGKPRPARRRHGRAIGQRRRPRQNPSRRGRVPRRPGSRSRKASRRAPPGSQTPSHEPGTLTPPCSCLDRRFIPRENPHDAPRHGGGVSDPFAALTDSHLSDRIASGHSEEGSCGAPREACATVA